MGDVVQLSDYKSDRKIAYDIGRREVWACPCGSRVFNVMHVKQDSGSIRCATCNIEFTDIDVTRRV